MKSYEQKMLALMALTFFVFGMIMPMATPVTQLKSQPKANFASGGPGSNSPLPTNSLYFSGDGGNDHGTSVYGSPAYNVGSGSFSVYFNVKVPAGWASQMAIAGVQYDWWDSPHWPGWMVWISGNSLFSTIYDAVNYASVSCSVPVNDGKWHQIAFIYDKSNAIEYFIVDGVQQTTGATVPGSLNSGRPLTVGSWAPQWGFYFTGYLNNMEFYNRALSSSEVSYISQYNTPQSTSNLGVWWMFSEGQGSTAIDQSGNGYTGTIWSNNGGGTWAGVTANAITNGGFETADFTGWTTSGSPIIHYPSQGADTIYEGSHSAENNHYYAYFYQPLSYPITTNSRFRGAMYAEVQIDDSDYHETVLTITASGLPTLYLHYRLQLTQPADTATDKYFLIGTQLYTWYPWNHNLYQDLLIKGAANYLGGCVIEIRCRQYYWCCCRFDSLELDSVDCPPLTYSGNVMTNGGFETGDFTGWTVGNHPIITYLSQGLNAVYEGSNAAMNNHASDFFYQSVNCLLTPGTRFTGAMEAIVYTYSSDYDDTMLTITKAGLPTIRLHYMIRVQGLQQGDTATDKYFLVGTQLNHWYTWDRSVYYDLIIKGAFNYQGGTVTEVRCQEGGVCCARFDGFQLVSNVIPVFVLDIATSKGSWVDPDRGNVYQGVLSAVSDAITQTPVKRERETIDVFRITDQAMLENMINCPALYQHGVFINAHAEVLPVTNSYVARANGGTPVLNWQPLIDRIAGNCRNYGWIWANVAGWGFYWASNTNYWAALQCLGQAGLQRFLGDNSALASGGNGNEVLGKWSYNEVGFLEPGFTLAYPRLPISARGARPISLSNPNIDLIGYWGSTDHLWYTAALVMRGIDPGILVHNGFASNAANGQDLNGDGVANSADDDWLKGYATAAMGIEEARSYLMGVYVFHDYTDGLIWSIFNTIFQVSMVPGSYRGGGTGGSTNYYSVDLRLSMKMDASTNLQIPDILLTGFGLTMGSNVGDRVKLDILTDKTGISTGATSSSIMDDLWWWVLGIVAGAASAVAGAAVGLIPIILNFATSTSDTWTKSGQSVSASVNTGSGWSVTATLGFDVRETFYLGSGTTYSINVDAASTCGLAYHEINENLVFITSS